jgi:hypothetical protein
MGDSTGSPKCDFTLRAPPCDACSGGDRREVGSHGPGDIVDSPKCDSTDSPKNCFLLAEQRLHVDAHLDSPSTSSPKCNVFIERRKTYRTGYIYHIS